MALATLSDGRIVSGSYDKSLRIWDASSCHSIATLNGHTNAVSALATLPDGRIVSGSADKTLRIWDASSHQSIAILKGHTDAVLALAVLPDGRIVSGSADKTLRIWDVNSCHSIATLNGHTNAVLALAVLPDGRIASGSADKTLRIWDADSSHSIANLTGHTDWVTALATLPDGRVVSGSRDSILHIWDANSHQSIAILKGHTDAVYALAVLPDGRIVSGSADKTLRIWQGIVPKLTLSDFDKLITALKSNAFIKSLSLARSDIDDSYLTTLSALLNSNVSITSLNLQNNVIGPDGAKALARMLEHNTSISELFLDNNKIKAEGAKAIANTLEKNTSLTSLTIDNNGIGTFNQGIKDRIKKYLQRNNASQSIKAKQKPSAATFPVPQAMFSKAKPVLGQAKVLYDYQAEDSHKLSVPENGTIDVLAKHDNGWWLCHYQGKEGLVPSNYIEEIRAVIEVQSSASILPNAVLEEAKPSLQASDTNMALSRRVQELEKSLNPEDILKELREILGQEAANLFTTEQEVLAAVQLSLKHQRLELEQYKQTLDSQYQILESEIEKLSKPRDARGEIPSDIAAQVEQLRQQQGILMAKYYKKQQVLAERNEISQFAELHSFYRIIQLKLNELFIACKAIASGKVTAERGKMGLAVDVIEIAGTAIPFGGGVIPAVFGLVANTYIAERKGKQASQASEMVVSIRELEKATEKVARLLTQRYANQIHLITAEGAQLLGECAVACILSSAAEGKVQANRSLVEQMSAAVSNTPLKKGLIPFMNKTIPTKQKGSTWTDEGVFKRSGIQTADGKYFSGNETRPEKYGYRNGTEQEALALGLKQDRQKIEIAGIGLSPAAASQLKIVTAQNANLEKNIEFIYKAKNTKDELQDKKLIELAQRNAEQDKLLKQQQEEIQQIKQMMQMMMQQNRGAPEPQVAQSSEQQPTATTDDILAKQGFFKSRQPERKVDGVHKQAATNTNWQ